MPWDYDADVQVTEADMYLLAAYHNMTIYYYKYGTMEKGRYFQLEINPYFVHRDQDDRSNVIDARWIDMQNGLYIDITAARYALNHEQGEGILYDKYGHEYRVRTSFGSEELVIHNVLMCSIGYICLSTARHNFRGSTLQDSLSIRGNAASRIRKEVFTLYEISRVY